LVALSANQAVFVKRALADAVHGLRQARAVLSYVEHPLVRQLYESAAIFQRQVRTFAGSATVKPQRTELLVIVRPGQTAA